MENICDYGYLNPKSLNDPEVPLMCYYTCADNHVCV